MPRLPYHRSALGHISTDRVAPSHVYDLFNPWPAVIVIFPSGVSAVIDVRGAIATSFAGGTRSSPIISSGTAAKQPNEITATNRTSNECLISQGLLGAEIIPLF